MKDRFKFRVWDNDFKKYRTGLGINNGLVCTYNDATCILEQCTGLKDKNGKLIYEGDILKSVHSDIMKYEIYWGGRGYRMKVYGRYTGIVDDTVIFIDTTKFEVIGNIHENADLLENEE